LNIPAADLFLLKKMWHGARLEVKWAVNGTEGGEASWLRQRRRINSRST
jgi:hypothetical protein